MRANIPLPVVRYLQSTSYEANPLAYLKLDAKNRIIEKGGELKHFGIAKLNLLLPVEEQLPALASLLPAAAQPVVIANSQLACVKFIDVHLYSDSNYQWVLLLDTTEAGKKLQSEQQIRLSNALNKEQKSG